MVASTLGTRHMNHVAMLAVDHDLASIVQDLLDNTSSVIYVKDLEFRYLMINRQYETLFHVSRTGVLGKTDFDIFSSDAAERFRANDVKVLESGESLQCEEEAPHDDGPHHYISLKFPLRDASGGIYAVAGISTDVTDRIRAAREMKSLQDRHELILDSIGDGICNLDAQGRIVLLNPAAERMLKWSTEELRGHCHSQILANGVLFNHQGRPAAPKSDGRIANDKTATPVEGARFRRRDGTVLPVECIVALIHDAGVHVGAVVAFRDTTDRKKQLEAQQEIQTARRIQDSLYPTSLPQIAGFEFAAISVSCSNACGDYYDFIPWGEDRWGITVGDVSGHGLGAALEMVETRAILRTTMLTEPDPVQCMTRLNKILTEDLPEDMFVTLFLAQLDTRNRTCSYASAGHEATLVRAGGEIRRLESTGTVLGLYETARFYGANPIQFYSGDVLLIATDGLAESISLNQELFGRRRIEDLLRSNQALSASEILSALLKAVEVFRDKSPQRDDITAVVIKAT